MKYCKTLIVHLNLEAQLFIILENIEHYSRILKYFQYKKVLEFKYVH